MRHHLAQLDAKLAKLRALQALGGGGGGSLLPLPRYAFITSDSTVSGQNGSVAEPFKSIAAWTASIAPTGASAADNGTIMLGKILQAAAGYTENISIPAYRSWELRVDGLSQIVTGGLTWHNTAAAGGLHAPAADFGCLHNVALTGGFVMTDDVGAPTSVLFFSSDEAPGAIQGLVDLTGATKVQAVFVNNFALAGGLTSHTGVTGATLAMLDANFTGALTCQSMSVIGSSFSTSAINLGASTQAATILGSFFNLGFAPVITTLNGGVVFDGPSIRSFKEAGGTVVSTFVLVIGGYAAGAWQGADLPTTGTNTNVSLNGVGATAGFTGANSGNVYYSHGLGADGASVTWKTGGGELPGDTGRIVKSDLAAHALAIKNNAGTTIATIPASSRGFVEVTFGTTDATSDWAMSGCGSLAA